MAFGTDRVSTGVAGLDAVTGGGLPANRLHLIEGGPGTGKTTMALQFLMDGVRQGEGVLYVTLSETVNELEGVARSHGWNLAGGSERRRMRLMKLGGAQYRGGYHDYVMQTGGLRIFRRLVAAEHHTAFMPEDVSNDLPKRDHLLGGGPQQGTSTLLVGLGGVGKSVLIGRYAATAAARGEHVTIYVFDERRATFLHRSTGLELSLERDAGG